MIADASVERGADAWGTGAIMRVGAAVLLYLRHAHLQYAAVTLKNQRSTLERFAICYSDTALKAVTRKHVEKWLAQQTCSPASLRVQLSHLRTFFRWAIEHHHLKTDPTVGIPKIRQPRALPRALNREELRALFAALPDARAELICVLLYAVGLRRAEVARIELADIDFYDQTIRIVGKGDHERMVPIVPLVAQALEKYLAERGRVAGPLVRSLTHPGRGISAPHLGALVSRWGQDAGVHLPGDGKSAHALRHTCAQRMWRNGTELLTISEALGHKDSSTTLIYLRRTPDMGKLRAALSEPYTD